MELPLFLVNFNIKEVPVNLKRMQQKNMQKVNIKAYNEVSYIIMLKSHILIRHHVQTIHKLYKDNKEHC